MKSRQPPASGTLKLTTTSFPGMKVCILASIVASLPLADTSFCERKPRRCLASFSAGSTEDHQDWNRLLVLWAQDINV